MLFFEKKERNFDDDTIMECDEFGGATKRIKLSPVMNHTSIMRRRLVKANPT